MQLFGVDREVRAVDDVSLQIEPNEIYGLAGESSSRQEHADQDHRRRHPAAAQRRRRLGAASTSAARACDLYAALEPQSCRRSAGSHLSYIMQGSMSVLNPVRRIRHAFVDFAFRHIGQPMPDFLRARRARICERLHLEPERARRLSARAVRRHAAAGDHRAGHRLPARVHHRRRADHGARRDRAEGRARDDPRGAAGARRPRSCSSPTTWRSTPTSPTGSASCMPAGWSRRARPRDIFREPRHPYTAHLIASLPRIGDAEPRKGLEGAPPNLADPPPGCRFHPRCPLAMEVCQRARAAA